MTAPWEAIAALATAVGSAVVLITAPIAIRQLADSKRSQRFNVFLLLFDSVSSPTARRTRADLYARFPLNRPPNEEETLVADDVLATLDRIWIMFDHEYVDEDFVVDVFGEVILRVWSVTRDYVEYERTRRGGYYRRRAEKLAKLVEARMEDTDMSQVLGTYKASQPPGP